MKFLEYLDGYKKRLDDIQKYEDHLKAMPNLSFQQVVLSVASHSDYLEEEYIYLRRTIADMHKTLEIQDKEIRTLISMLKTRE